MYAPSDGVVPLPSDLLFAGSLDGTLTIPGVDDGSNPNATPVEIALAASNGWSTTAPLTIEFSNALDATTLVAGTSVRIYEVLLNTSNGPVGGPVDSVVAELTGGTDFLVGLAPEVSAGTSARVYFQNPLKSGTSYMWVLTNAITTEEAVPLQKVGEYLLASSPDFFPMTAPIFPLQVLINSHLAAATGQGLVREDIVLTNVFTTQGVTAVPSTLAAIVGGQESAIISALCASLPSACAGEDLNPDPNNTSSLVVNQTSTITTMDRIPGSPGAADLFTGELTIPYYLTPAANPSDTAPVINPAPLSVPMTARYAFLPGDTERNLTSFNPLPASTGQETIPVLISVPNATSTQVKPPGGWPVVIFQHGITANRLSMLPIADAYANQGIMVVAIDLPLHGLADTSDAVLFAGFDANQPGARERIFGLDLVNPLGAAGPDGMIDSSGAHFLNLGNLLVARDNLTQSTSDLLHLFALLPTLDYDGAGSDVDATRIHFVGHSLGGIVGTPFLTLAAPNVQSATLAMSGGGIAKLLDGSQSFGPVLEAGLGSVNVIKGTPNYEAYLWGAQTVLDRMDPVNYAATLAALGTPIHFIEVIGDGTVPNDVGLAPLSGSGPLIRLLGLTQITMDTTDPGGIRGFVRFTEGGHASLISPAASGAAFSEMQAETVEFSDSSGTALTLVNETVIETMP